MVRICALGIKQYPAFPPNILFKENLKAYYKVRQPVLQSATEIYNYYKVRQLVIT